MSATTTTTERIPCDAVLRHAAKHSLSVEKPMMLDYWAKSVKKDIFIGVRPTGEKLLVKNSEEYTSPIAKIFKVETDYIIETENSLYLVCASITSKRLG
jgi:hypothetical protein